MAIKSYGVSSLDATFSQDDLLVEEYTANGFAVISDVLNTDHLVRYNELAEEVYAAQREEFGAESLAAIKDLDMARAALAYADEFLDLVFHDRTIPIVEKILGTYYILSLQNCIINRPGIEHHQSSWHRDLPYQEFTSSKPLGVNIFYCLCDFNEHTGGTIVLPGSHRLDKFPTNAFVEKHEFQVEAPAGSAILFDPMLFHRAGTNKSTIVRRGVNHLYTRAFIKQQINLPRLLAGKSAQLTHSQKQVLGFGCDVPDSVVEWRRTRLKTEHAQP